MKKVLVTGGTFFVSKYTATYFVEHGYEVYVINRNTKTQPDGVILIESDRHELGDRLKDIHFDIVADITAYTKSDITDLLDSLGSFDQYIMMSSGAVYPEDEKTPFTEDTAVGPNKYFESYGTDKIEAEKALLERVPDAYILRPAYIYGPMNGIYRESFVFDCAKEGRPFYVPGDGNMRLQFIHIHDLLELLNAVLEKRPETHIINAGNPEYVTAKEWAELCYSCLGKRPSFEYVYADMDSMAYFPFHEYELLLDVSLQESICPVSISMRDGLMGTLEWYEDNEKEVRKKGYLDFIESEFKKKQ